jgi:hypothetical protein
MRFFVYLTTPVIKIYGNMPENAAITEQNKSDVRRGQVEMVPAHT